MATGSPDARIGAGPMVRRLGVSDYRETWDAMRRYTEHRTAHAHDQIWLLEHCPVFTLGRAGDERHVLSAGDIPVVRTDRGGQVTYHGPGQLVVYLLLDLARRDLGVRKLVAMLEGAVIALLSEAGLTGHRRDGAPGVYVSGRKLCALGLRVRRGCCYHGLALNVSVDLEPFSRIHPCGYPELEVTRLRDLGVRWTTAQTGRRLLARLSGVLAAPGRE